MSLRLISFLALSLSFHFLVAVESLTPFVLPWNDTTVSPISRADLNPKPAGSLGPIQAREGHLFAGEQRIRIFGVNLTSGACFPDSLSAELIAARMAKFGINGVRLHFLDSTWGESPLIDYSSGSWEKWNSKTLDRLDYFVSQLEKNGIYINLNLLVGRRFGMNDGVSPDINQLGWKIAHVVGFFHKPHLEAQKAYALKLLSHQNPYTHLSYAEDPAVAFVEINNESGLLSGWLSNHLVDLPTVFSSDLQSQWNDWLKTKYHSTEELCKAWGAFNQPLGTEALTNGNFKNNHDGWIIEEHENAHMVPSFKEDSLALKVIQPGKENWHLQLYQANLKLTKNAPYTLSFKASSSSSQKISVRMDQATSPWGNLGFQQEIQLTPLPQVFRFSFSPLSSDSNARLCFSQFKETQVDYRFAEISFKPGGEMGFTEHVTIEEKTIPLLKSSNNHLLTQSKKADWVEFLMETENNYWTEMRQFIRDTVGFKSVIVGTAAPYSTPGLMKEMDIVDAHAYWRHPQFPGKEWDENQWTVTNDSMVDSLSEATVTQLTLNRVLGKPFMVSEYNHPAPNSFASEGPLFLASFAGLQDWDALFLYTYSENNQHTQASHIPCFFDIGQHPSVMANALVASIFFRRDDITPTEKTISLPLSHPKELQLICEKGTGWNPCPVNELGLAPQNSILYRIGLEVTKLRGTSQKLPEILATQNFISENGQARWLAKEKNKGIFEIHSPKTKIAIGHLDGKTIDLGEGIKLTIPSTQNGWCTAALTLLEGDSIVSNPTRLLLVLTGNTENQSMLWKNKEKSSVGSDWGKAPTLIEPIHATLTLPCQTSIPLLYPLDERGNHLNSGSPAQLNSGNILFEIKDKTLWYEIIFP